ncbi:MAG: glycosyltransferase family 9 protein [Planctomycetes bacterium]|nr:glycosyltransferase family 9 protein [Planctomycetota bacterium]
MRVSTMRAVDRGLGRPACAILTGVRRVLPERAPPASADVRRVLFVKLSEMGALVLACPAFAEARRTFPNAEIWLLCFDENAEIAEVAAEFPRERIVTVPSKGVVSTLTGILGAIRRVRSLGFDVVVDLEYFSRVSAILTYLSGAPIRAGFHRFEAEGLYCGDLYTHRATWNATLHVAQSMAALVRAAAADPAATPLLKEPPPRLDELTFPTFHPTPADLASVRATLDAAGVPAGVPILLVNPNSSDLLPLRRWPEERFVALCRALRDGHPGAWVVVTGAPHEAALGGRIVAATGGERCASVIGKTDLRGLLTLFTLSRVLVSADSGPPHFAALTALRVVTLFGPETPALYGPVNDRNTAITAGLACSPCIHAWNRRVSTCTDNQCMQRIAVAQVVAAVNRHG